MYDINDLSGKQRKIFLYIKDYIDEKGYPPTVRDICEAVDLKSTSHRYTAIFKGLRKKAL